MNWTRRDVLKTGTAALTSMAGAGLNAGTAVNLPKGKADACIFLWLGGGAAHIDTFDAKQRGDGIRKAGSYYDSIETAIAGARVCEHLKKSAPLMDRCALVRSVTHTIKGEHAAAANLLHTGRMPSGTIQYPAIGS